MFFKKIKLLFHGKFLAKCQNFHQMQTLVPGSTRHLTNPWDLGVAWDAEVFSLLILTSGSGESC